MIHSVAENNPICFTLAPDIAMVPADIRLSIQQEYGENTASSAAILEEFSLTLIESLTGTVEIIRILPECFTCYGSPGMTALENIIETAKKHNMYVIVDNKTVLTESSLPYLPWYHRKQQEGLPDSVTVIPYTYSPSLFQTDTFLFFTLQFPESESQILHTSIGDSLLYEHITEELSQLSTPFGIVLDTNYPEDISYIQQLAPEAPLLLSEYFGDAQYIKHLFAGRAPAIIGTPRALQYSYLQNEHLHYGQACREAVQLLHEELLSLKKQLS